MPETVVLLHGFGGTSRMWDAVSAQLDPERYRPLALDLPGHGCAADVRPITFDSCVEHVLAQSPRRFALCGYSLGGRIALQVALAAPQRVTRLVLVACSAGIEDDAERAARRRADAQLAARLVSESFDDFIERWRSQPLFAAEPAHVGALARADHRRNRPDALAAALGGVGAGEMLPLWERLDELKMPVTVLAGERDHRYQRLGRQMATLLARGSFQVVAGGHALALENPHAVARALQRVDTEAGAGRNGDRSFAHRQRILKASEQA